MGGKAGGLGAIALDRLGSDAGAAGRSRLDRRGGFRLLFPQPFTIGLRPLPLAEAGTQATRLMAADAAIASAKAVSLFMVFMVVS